MQYRVLAISEVSPKNLSWWQSASWASILMTSGQAQEVFYYGNISSSYLLVEIRSLGFGMYGAFGLGITNHQLASDWDACISALEQELRSKNILFLQLEPLNLELKVEHTQKPYKKFLTPHTRVLDLSQSRDTLLAQMHEKGRYNIKLAMKRGVQIDQVPGTSDNIDIWMNLLADTLSRDGFSGNSRQYYEIFIRHLEKNTQGGLYFARFEGRVIAGAIFVWTSSRAIYYYGASSSSVDDRKQMAPYLLQWTAICEAKDRKIPIYDFLGVADPADPTDSLLGVTSFKEKFGGTMETLPTKALYPLSWKYRIYSILQRIKTFSRKKYI